LAEVKVAGWKGLKEEYKDSLTVRGIDPKVAKERMDSILDLLKEYSPVVMKEPDKDSPGLIRVEKDDTAIFIAVYSDGMVVLASDILDVINKIVEYKEEKGVKALVVIYSRKGRLGPLCYLFLGDVIRDKEVGVLYVNGSVREVLDVVRDIMSKGEYLVKEEDYVDLKNL
jgi:hypothetical protein